MRLLVSVSAAALTLGSAMSAGAQPPATAPASAPPPADPAAAPADAAADPFATPAPLPGASADAGASDATLDRDPYEKFNRAMWGFDQTLDRVALKPAAQAYRFVTPHPVRRGISHIFSNLTEPWSFINNLLQGKVDRAMKNLGRFVVNTTIGVGGLADNAAKIGIRPAPEDFGQTLAVWGARHSPYLVLPLFGPSTIRDGIGTAVAYFGDPYPICLKECTSLKWRYRVGIQAVSLLNTRSELIDSGADAFLESSLDPYASARSAYLQSRAADIADESDESMMSRPADLNPTTPNPQPEPVPAPTGTAPAAPGVATPPPAAGADPFATPPPLAKEPSAASGRPDGGLASGTVPGLPPTLARLEG